MSQKKLLKLLASLGLLVVFLIGFNVKSAQQRTGLEIDYLDVGQGDAILIKTPYQQNILIDGGPDNSVLQQLGNNLAFFDKNIDLVILTHPHADHVTGLVEVLRRYKVKKVLLTGVLHTAPDYLTFLDEIKKQNIAMEIVKSPEDIILGNDLDLKILYPLTDYSGQKVDNLNNTSIVSKLIYKNNSFLFTGDAQGEEESELLKNKIDLSADVLKVAHHGSKYSSILEFLEAVNPQYAVVLAGKDNKFGHPHQAVLDRLIKNQIEILRTDQLGTIILISDGNNIQIKNRN